MTEHADYSSWPAYLAKGASCVGKLLLREARARPALSAAAAGLAAGRLAAAVRRWHVPSGTVLELDLDALRVVSPEPTPLSRRFGQGGAAQATARALAAALRQAAGDARVAALVVRLGNNHSVGVHFMLMAAVEELRDAVAAVRAAGKLTVAYAECVGEASSAGAAAQYYLASAFEHLFLAPCGMLSLTEQLVESMFVARALEKLGLAPELRARKEYKNFINTLTERAYTPEHREATARIVESLREQFYAAVAEGRGVDGGPAEVAEHFAAGPFLAAEAARRGLVDGLLYRDEVLERVAGLLGRKGGAARLPLLFLRRYAEKRGPRHGPRRGATRVALVTASGAIHRGESKREWTGVATSIGSDTLCRELRAAAADRKVRAIVLHVDSRGGSYVASDMVAREVQLAREAGKKVVAVMGNVAASGGYFVSMRADRIVAQGTTLTGSIGVVYGKMVTRGMWDKLGVDWDSVVAGDNALVGSSLHKYTAEGNEVVDGMLDAIYADFVGKVAAARGLTPEQAEEVARGRVWTGRDALERGLVDEIGGLERGVEVARELLGLEPDAPVHLKRYPVPVSPLARLLGAGGAPANSRDRDRRGVAASASPVAAALATLGAGSAGAAFSPAALAGAVLDAVRNPAALAQLGAELGASSGAGARVELAL